MPFEEREDVINYYIEYFAEAGPQREQEIIERLGPPQRVAAEIRADAALHELNSKAERAARARETRRAKRMAARGAAANTPPAGAQYAAAADGNMANDSAEATGDAPNTRLGESISASWLGTVGMLGMPIARPFAVLAFVIGIIGLVLCVIVVAAIYAAAGSLAVSGIASLGMAFVLLAQDASVAVFFFGCGMAGLGAGLVIGVLNYMLGRAIFKGIANLSGRIRRGRVKIRKETFHYSYGNNN
jgi:uncharacterized membrane protein